MKMIKNYNIRFCLVLFIGLLFNSCIKIQNDQPQPITYEVTYEILYPTKTVRNTYITKKGKGKIVTAETGYFGNGPLRYIMRDDSPNILIEDQYPIVIIKQKRIY